MKIPGFRRAVRVPPERQDHVQREIDEELAFHLAMREERLRQRGLTPGDAALEARRRFGDIDSVRAECIDTDIAELRAVRFRERVADVLRDLRVAARSLRRSPGFALSCAALLALSIGGTASVFSIVSAIYLRPLPYPAADRLAIARASRPDPRCGGLCARPLTASEVSEWRARAHSIDAAGTIELRQGVVDVSGSALILEGAAVNAELVPLFDLHAALGRGLLPADFADGAPGALVLSHSAWESEFGGDSAVVGQRATIDGRTYRIVGVLAPELELGPPVYSFNVRTAQYLVPWQPGSTANQQVIVRMRPGVAPKAVASELDAVLRPADAGSWRATVEPLRTALATRYRGSFSLLLSASGVVLLLVCINVGALFVARLHDRLTELATRAVLGAGRAQLVQQVLTETTLIGLAGAVGGISLAAYGVRVARLIPADRLPYWTPVVLDARVVSLAVGLALAAGLLSSVGPALMLSPQRMLSMRALVSSAPQRTRIRSLLVSAEIALSVALFVVAGILVQQLVAAERRDLSTAQHSVVFVAVSRQSSIDASWPDRVIARLRTLPRVTSVAITGMPIRPRRVAPAPAAAARGGPGPVRRAAVYAEGRNDPIPDLAFPSAGVVTPEYFGTVGMPITAGRAFRATDDVSAPAAAIINESAARRAFPNGSAVGKRIRIEAGGALGDWLTIVGVTPDERASPFDESPGTRATMFRPWRQVASTPSSVAIHVIGDSREIVPLLRDAFRTIDAAVPIASISPIETRVDNEMWSARFTTRVLAGFALFALVLACLGVYALVSFVVGRRRHELAIRVAVGATGRDVLVSVLGPAARFIAAGLAGGVLASLIATRLLRSMLLGARGVDVSVIVVAVAAILIAGISAAYVPARRAMSADPLAALRAE